MTIAVTGATGQLGRLVVEALKQKTDETIIALVRNPEKAADLGVEARAFDYGKPETLAPALAGIDTLLLISGNEVGKRAAQHRNVIQAAKEAGVPRIVYTSLLHADSSPLLLADEHHETEGLLRESGLDFTILRNGWYTENYTASVAPAVTNGTLYGAAGNGRIAAAARGDYADAAVVVLTTGGHNGETYELAGTPSFTLTDLAAEISTQTGKTIPYVNLTQADYAAALEQAGMPAEMAQAVASFDAGAADGALDDTSDELTQLIGRQTTPLSASVKAALQS